MRTDSRQRPRAAALAIVLIVAGIGGLVVGAGPASADVDSVQGSAFGLSVDDNLLGLLNIPPTPTVSLSANEATPPAGLGPVVDSLLAIPSLLNLVTASALDVSVSAGRLAGEDHTGFVTSFARLANATVGANILNPLISVNGLEIQCIADGDGARVPVGGFTGILRVQVGTEIREIDLSTVAPNTVVDVLGVVRLTLNKQEILATPGSASIRARAIEAEVLPAAGLPLITTALDVVIGEVFCAAQGPDVLVTTLPPTTAPPTTAPPTTAPPTTAPPTTAPPTTAPPTTAPPVTTAPPTTGPTTTRPPTVTTAPPTVQPTVVVTVLVPVNQTVLARTGSTLQPLAVLSVLSLVMGVLLLIGSSMNPVPITAGGWSDGPARPEKWGPMEIGKTIWAGLAALALMAAKPFKRR